MAKRKYPLDEELAYLSNSSLFPNINVYPFVNIFMGMIRCKSDDKVSVEKRFIAGYQGYKLPVLIIEPRNAKDKLPCIIFNHGGGLILKAVGAHYQFAKWYAEKLVCKVIMPDYRLMPKYRFPYAVEDCYCTYEWVLDNADELGIDDSKVILTGDSAGGNISAAVVLMAIDRNRKLPSGVLMVYPALDRRMITESMKKYTDTPVLNTKLAKMYFDEMLINGLPEHIEYASPMEAKSLTGFPPSYIEVAEFDALHDDGILFAKRLEDEGIPVEFHEVKGSCHGYEVATKSNLVKKSMDMRIEWGKKIWT
ncbi:alpha/beta hydrolase [Butyrivibrio proteoclasticus]|uniref:alpha/beta hydrolase n=1 Tax=Butyrivibrio proteoclasticus TaxID=43305 RepID=UPI000683F9F4|nr:alpha/beta hydrolase [Butyrivibrio proteoclasticus]